MSTKAEVKAATLARDPLVRELLDWIVDEYWDAHPPESWAEVLTAVRDEHATAYETQQMFRPPLPIPPAGRAFDPRDPLNRFDIRRACLARELRKLSAAQLASIESPQRPGG